MQTFQPNVERSDSSVKLAAGFLLKSERFVLPGMTVLHPGLVQRYLGAVLNKKLNLALGHGRSADDGGGRCYSRALCAIGGKDVADDWAY